MSAKNDQVNLLTRGIKEVIPSKKALEKALFEGKQLTVYHGVDPTAPSLHLGHSTNYIFLRKLQELGHKIILLIGDFTASIGDPTGRTGERALLTRKQILENCKTYKDQAAKILDFKSRENPVRIEYNSKWLQGLTLESIIDIASHFTVQQMITREMFQRRIKNESPIGLNEFLYPLMQGYDSVALKADVEVGGNDQMFNMLIGRDLARAYLNKNKFVITTKLLINPKTGNKLMSKSEGGYIALNDAPNEMYGKVMALPDEVISDCFELCTEVLMAEVEKIMKTPLRDAKARLAREIVAMYHGRKMSEDAEREFNKVFTKHEAPSDIPVFNIKKEKINIIDLLVEVGLAPSKSEARRLVEQSGVKINNKTKTDQKEEIIVKDGMLVQVGKRRFAKITPSPNSRD